MKKISKKLKKFFQWTFRLSIRALKSPHKFKTGGEICTER